MWPNFSPKAVLIAQIFNQLRRTPDLNLLKLRILPQLNNSSEYWLRTARSRIFWYGKNSWQIPLIELVEFPRFAFSFPAEVRIGMKISSKNPRNTLKLLLFSGRCNWFLTQFSLDKTVSVKKPGYLRQFSLPGEWLKLTLGYLECPMVCN